jgi:hypothetical protein
MLEHFDSFAAEDCGRDIVVSHFFVFDLLVVCDVVAVWSKCLLLGALARGERSRWELLACRFCKD